MLLHRSHLLPSALFSLAAGLAAQCPPGAPMPADLTTLSATPAPDSPAAVRWNLGKRAAADGRTDEAQQHLLRALELHPCSPAVLLDLLLAAGDDTDQQRLWGERFVRAAADARGKLKLDRETRKQLPATADIAAAETLAQKRALAVAELARFVNKHRPAGKKNSARAQLVGFASDLLLALGEGAPGPLGEHAPKVAAIAADVPPDYDLALQGLVRVMRQIPDADDDPVIRGRAIRAARILVGLARQASFRDLQGPPPPDLETVANQARRFFADSDRAVHSGVRVWTIAELEALSAEQRVRFTDEHDSWLQPGVALSTTGRYRIETVCGHQTLLATARTVELHHNRLVAHFGKDPFVDRQGVVRVVPENADLETEGAPYWWASGFQSGDRTTVRFAWGAIPSLGRLLTHELTHRFDGKLRPFMRPWYVEGHAVWTGAHYGSMRAEDFVDDHLRYGAVDSTWRKDYGRRAEFEKLIEGELEEYRDNYQAGYALYAYLRGYPPKQPPLYREALEKFERNARAGRRDPLGYFEKTFCDGTDGRPKNLDDFIAGWQTFLSDVGRWLVEDRDETNRWVPLYGRIEGAEQGRLVMDRPTWSWARTRAEPFFGQDHAAAATRLLGEVGDDPAPVAAGLWSIAVDGWRPDTVRATLDAAGRLPDKAAAQAFAALARRRFPSLPPADGATLAAQLPRTVQFLTALAERARALAASDAPIAAAALAAEHDALAARLDLTPLGELAVGAPPAVPNHLGGHGWSETSLTSFDERRTRGLWYAAANGDLHVGRARPREGTGTVDRRAHRRDAFVHSVGWQAPGAFVLRGRVHFTTAYVSGAIVFGHWRRDRGLRLLFSYGDYDYAVGRSERNQASGRIRMRLEGLWERDAHMPRTNLALEPQVADEAAWFDYELQIRGPRVVVRINGEEPRTYAVHDGAPIEGHVGFAMTMGAIRVQEPTVQRLDGLRDGAMVGFDLARQPLVGLDDLLHLPTRGLPVDPRGTLVLWVPREGDEIVDVTLPRSLPVIARLLNSGHLHPQPWVLALPRQTTGGDRTAIQRQIAKVRGAELPVVQHDIGAPFEGRYPWVLFVDGLGVLRAAADVSSPRVHSRVHRWSRMFRPR